jgi:hypothetical protein
LICHQYLVPGVQVGAKVSADEVTGAVTLMHVMERPVSLGNGCLECAGVIPADALAEEQLSERERRAQAYIEGASPEQLEDPSVITLNSISTSLAATDFLLMVTGLLDPTSASSPRAYYPQVRELRERVVSARAGCRFCDPEAPRTIFASGDGKTLSLHPGSKPWPETLGRGRVRTSQTTGRRTLLRRLRTLGSRSGGRMH